MASTTNPKIRLKLLIDNSSGKVLFAEAGKDFVDFLFGLLELPLGTVLALLDKHGMNSNSGAPLAKIYDSVKNLDNSYLKTSQTKDSLLRPKFNNTSNTKHTPLLKQLAYPYQLEEVIISTPAFPSLSSTLGCSSSSLFGSSSSVFGSSSPTFGFSSTPAVCSSSSAAFGRSPVGVLDPSSKVVEGYVKGVVTYMVMDDLMVKPMSTISSVTLLNTFAVKDIGCLQEKTVDFDIDKGLKLFTKALYQSSSTVLTDLFLPIN